jgi:uncharacterized membrane protein (UPF0182 family)
MKIDRPLINPSITDFTQESEVDQTEQESVPVLKDQIPLDIDAPLKAQQLIGATRMAVRKRVSIIEVVGVWRNASLPFALTSMVLMVLVLIVGAMFNFNNMGTEIPIFYNAQDGHWESLNKTWVFILPIIIAAIEIAIINFSFVNLRYDKRLSYTVSWLLTFLNVMLLIAVGQIFTLVSKSAF